MGVAVSCERSPARESEPRPSTQQSDTGVGSIKELIVRNAVAEPTAHDWAERSHDRFSGALGPEAVDEISLEPSNVRADALQNAEVQCGIRVEDPRCGREEPFKFDVGPCADADADCFENFGQLNEKVVMAWVWLSDADFAPL